MNWWMQLMGCFVAACAFAALIRLPKPAVLVSALIAMAGYGIFMLLGQGTLAYFLATLFIGITCEICARIMKRASTLFITGAIIPLVPGVGLYRTMRYVAEGDYSQALSTGTATLMGLCAIALAITISSVLFVNFRRASKKDAPC